MADTKISALTALTGATVDTAADLLPIVDTSVTTTKKITVDELRIALLSNTALTNSIAADVLLNNASNYFTGPTVAQGTTGTWFASGSVLLLDTNNYTCEIKLWDGATVIASSHINALANVHSVVALSGFIATPAGNIRISVKDSSTAGSIMANVSGNSKDSTITVFRIG